eukprot:m.4311 g.4311  ORF g.4311 m.4311 type:complete len:286 (+) comp3856_c1_seq1:80-937(+)
MPKRFSSFSAVVCVWLLLSLVAFFNTSQFHSDKVEFEYKLKELQHQQTLMSGEQGKVSVEERKTALVMGATGLVGGFVLRLALADQRYAHVIAPTRRALGSESFTEEEKEKLLNPVGSDVIASIPNSADGRGGAETIDHVFMCLGTTRAKCPNAEVYREIEVEMPKKIAGIAVQNHASYLGVVSSRGASKTSSFPYMKQKGEMEENMLAAEVPNVTVLRPSIIFGDRQESRMGESVAKVLAKGLHYVLPKNTRGIHARTIAERLVSNAFKTEEGKVTIESGSIKE